MCVCACASVCECVCACACVCVCVLTGSEKYYGNVCLLKVYLNKWSSEGRINE